MIKNYSIFILALFILMQHARATDWADGASMTGEEYSFPNLVYSPSLPPYKDVIGVGDTSTPAADAAPPPTYCLYPPPAKPAMPALLPPVASPPGASPTPTTGPPSIAPGITPPGGASPPAGLPSIAPGIISPPGSSPLTGSPSVVPGSSAPPPPLPFVPPGGASPLAPAGPPSIAPGIISPPDGASLPAGSPSVAPGSSAPPPFMPPPAVPAPGGQEERRGTWCVANPKAASAVVQTAMDYACGSGADCGSVAAPGGACYLPDTLAAHASYAFNSYWQRTKAAGGTCDFAGAAMLVTTDPSHDGCKFVCM